MGSQFMNSNLHCFGMFHPLVGRSTVFLEDIGGPPSGEYFLFSCFLASIPRCMSSSRNRCFFQSYNRSHYLLDNVYHLDKMML
jgi:hypothetical protein